MGITYLLGAGFSHAVSGLPLMKELTNTFRKAQREFEKSGDTFRAELGCDLLHTLEDLERRSFPDSIHQEVEAGGVVTSTFLDNLESLLSYIDINISNSILIDISYSDKTRRSIAKACAFYPGCDLTELRSQISTYLCSVVDGPYGESSLLRRFVTSLAESDSVVTFNYDLLVESELWSQGKWSPLDGYGIEINNESFAVAQRPETSIPIYKLHGSINWEPGFFDADKITLRRSYDNGESIFPKFFKSDAAERDMKYNGKRSPFWLLPSYVKKFSSPMLVTLWRKARLALAGSDDIVIIGYSLPEADSAAWLLLGSVDLPSKAVTIVDPCPDALRERLRRILGVERPTHYPSLQDFLDARYGAGRDGPAN